MRDRAEVKNGELGSDGPSANGYIDLVVTDDEEKRIPAGFNAVGSFL